MSLGPTDSLIEEELQKLEGVWKQIAYERDGVKEPLDEQGWEPSTLFTASEFIVTLADGSIPIRGTYRIDPFQNPKTIDWNDTIGEDAGKTLLAIYSLQDDRFMFVPRTPAWSGRPNSAPDRVRSFAFSNAYRGKPRILAAEQ